MQREPFETPSEQAAQRSKLMNQNGMQPPQQKKQRWWSKRGMKIGGGFLVMVVLLVLSYIAAVAIAIGPITAYRMLTSLDSNIYTYKIFPQRAIATGGSVSTLKQASQVNFPTTITFSYNGSHYITGLKDLFAQTDTQAFIVIRNNTMIYEKYLNGAHRDTLFTSFSMAKSFTSALIGIAIDEGKIKSVNDPVIRYVPELKGRGFDRLTIRDMLLMSTGVAFQHDNGLFLPFRPFLSDDAKQYYTTNLRQLILSVRSSDQPIGVAFHYNDFYALLEGLILKRVTGETIAQFTQDKLWQPMGMGYSASWSLDSSADGFEKTNSALNARAIDFARFGLMFLNNGRWNGQQIISRRWVTESTTPDPADRRSWKDDPTWHQAGGDYKYNWWGLKNPDGTYDYLAWGKDGQFIYVSPSTNTVIVRLGGQEAYPWPFALRALIGSMRTELRH
jgi:CubicO group peptidase (beta-lactamase class C family)